MALTNITAGMDDAMYVTDSDVRIKASRERVREGDGRIFRIEPDGDVEVAIHGEELHSPTGITWDGTRFLVAQGYGNEIVAWQPSHDRKRNRLLIPSTEGGWLEGWTLPRMDAARVSSEQKKAAALAAALENVNR